MNRQELRSKTADGRQSSRKDEVIRQTEADMAFEERISAYSKQALVMTLTQLSSSEQTRDWIEQCLHQMEQMLEWSGLSDAETELSTTCQIGPNGVAYRGHRYWASWMANMQDRKVSLRFPAESGCLHVVDSDGQYLGKAHRIVNAKGKSETADNKTADPVGAGPAAQDESTNKG